MMLLYVVQSKLLVLNGELHGKYTGSRRASLPTPNYHLCLHLHSDVLSYNQLLPRDPEKAFEINQ